MFLKIPSCLQKCVMKKKKIVVMIIIIFITGILIILRNSSQSSKNESRYVNLSENLELYKNDSFVSLCPERLAGYHRTGNHLFMLSAMLDMSEKTGRTLILPHRGWLLDEVFNFNELGDNGPITIKRYEVRNEICPCEQIYSPHFSYDHRFNESTFIDKYTPNNFSNPNTVEICGLSQTFLYSLNPEVSRQLHSLPRILKDDAYDKAQEIIGMFKTLMNRRKLSSYVLYSYKGFKSDQKKNKNSKLSYLPLTSYFDCNSTSSRKIDTQLDKDLSEIFLVGVHLRMGDFLKNSHVNYGLTVANSEYFKKSFKYFINLRSKILFIVISDDIEWAIDNFPDFFQGTDNNLNQTSNNSSDNFYNNKNVQTIFFRDSVSQDLALLCRSDALIISTGTFGWWAAWFNNQAPIIYYEDYPKPNTTLGNLLPKITYYPPHWIPMK